MQFQEASGDQEMLNGMCLEIYTDMMKVPEGEQFPRQDYADVFLK